MNVYVPKILLVGGGLSSSFTYYFLAKMLSQVGQQAQFVLWEKDSQLGGRMRHGSLLNASEPAEVGLQYVSTSQDDAPIVSALYEQLQSEGVLAPLTEKHSGVHRTHCDRQHYRIVGGSASLISDYLLVPSEQQQQELIIQRNTICRAIAFDQVRSKWIAKSSNALAGEMEEEFDALIIGIPPICNNKQSEGGVFGIDFDKVLLAPHRPIFDETIEPSNSVCDTNFLGAATSTQNKLFAFLDSLESVTYSRRFAFSAVYPSALLPVMQQLDWSFRYIYDDPIIRYISIQNTKAASDIKTSEPNADLADANVTLMIHTNVQFPDELEATGDLFCQSHIKERIVTSLHRIMPVLQPYSPLSTDLVYWRQSQVTNSLASNYASSSSSGGGGIISHYPHCSATFAVPPSSVSSSLCSTSSIVSVDCSNSRDEGAVAPLSFVGDYFQESKFKDCVRSAHEAARALSRILLSSK